MSPKNINKECRENDYYVIVLYKILVSYPINYVDNPLW